MSNNNDEITEENYLDPTFINIVNSLELENFQNILTYFIDNYSCILSEENFENFSKIISQEIKSDIPLNNICRQMKYLINRGIYSRLSKAFLGDLLSLGFDEDKLNLLREIQKKNLEKILKVLHNDQMQSESNIIKGQNRIIDVNVKTEMPSFTTNYNFLDEFDNEVNEDIKKQNIYMNFTLDKNIFSENIRDNKDGKNGNYKNLTLKMNKKMLGNFYAEMEKIQESLDKLG